MSEDRKQNQYASTRMLCTHCGLPVPPSRVLPQNSKQFCCNGCRSVHELIQQHGLNYFYDLRHETSSPSFPATNAGAKKEFAHYDSSEFEQLYVRTLESSPQRLARIELFLEGIHCSACVWLIERLPHVVPGVAHITVDFGRSTAVLEYQPDQVQLSSIAETLTRFGYRPHPYRGAQYASLRKEEERRLLSALGVAGACAGNAMLIAICLYAASFGFIDNRYWNFFRITSLFVALPTVVWSARIFYRGAFSSLRVRRIHLDVPISLGILVGFIASSINVWRAEGEIYFDSITMIVFLLLVSRFLQFRAQHKAAEKAEFLFSLLPRSAHRIRGSSVEDVPLESLQRGDIVEVRAGEGVPVDGVVLQGESLIDTAILSGESFPQAISVGSAVHAGVTNLSSVLRLEVVQTGEETRLGRISRLATDVLRHKPRIVHAVDRLSPWFVMIVLCAASIAFLLGLEQSPAEGIERFVAVLVISCPCALGMATPLAFSTAIGFAARIGIHLRGSDALEALRLVRHVVFDKTGTLTTGKLAVVEAHGDPEAFAAAAAVEAASAHPVAQAIVAHFRPRTGELSQVSETPGKGISALLGGDHFIIGSEAYLQQLGRTSTGPLAHNVQAMREAGLSVVYIARNDVLVGVLGVGDPLQAEAAAAVAFLKRQGYLVHLISGDHPSVVERVAETLGIPQERASGSVAPEGKLQYIQNLGANSVLMFGDGTNDAAALAGAGIGIAAHGGAEPSLLVADAFFSRPDLRLVPAFILGAKRTLAKVRRNLLLSLSFNFLGISLALFGYISPLVAAILMPISSFVVVVSSFADNPFAAKAVSER